MKFEHKMQLVLLKGFMVLKCEPLMELTSSNRIQQYKKSFKFEASSPNSSPVSTMQKFDFDQTVHHMHIPVKSCKQLFPGVVDRDY